MRRIACRNDWKTLPGPAARMAFDLPLEFSAMDFDRICRGWIPDRMEEKWFVFFEDGWLHCYRSWTGAPMFGARFETIPGGARIAEAWVGRGDGNDSAIALDSERAMLATLIRSLAGR